MNVARLTTWAYLDSIGSRSGQQRRAVGVWRKAAGYLAGSSCTMQLEDGRGRPKTSHGARFLQELGISLNQSSRWQRIAGIPDDLARRHLDPHEWGGGFKKLAESRGVQLGKRGPKFKGDCNNSEMVAELATECGVDERTSRRRVRWHSTYEVLPADLRKLVDTGEMTLAEARRQQRKRETPTQSAEIEHVIEASMPR